MMWMLEQKNYFKCVCVCERECVSVCVIMRYKERERKIILTVHYFFSTYAPSRLLQ